MTLRLVLGGVATAIVAALVFVGVQVSGLSTTVETKDAQLADQVSELKIQNDDLTSEMEDLQQELDTVGTTTGVEKMKTQLVNLRTCFAEALAAVQQASVQGYVSNYQSGDVEGWLDLGRFSSDCEPYLPDYSGD